MKALWTVRKVVSPYGQFRGYRLIVAQPNVVSSFAAMHQIAIFGDLPTITAKQARNFLRQVRRQFRITKLQHVRTDTVEAPVARRQTSSITEIDPAELNRRFDEYLRNNPQIGANA